jgi:hypothetical protein
MNPRLEEVFKLSGVPTHTFVRPVEHPRLLVALRTAAVGSFRGCLRLSARRRDDVDLISALPEMSDVGTVVVDDFHRLPETQREQLADFLKPLTDEGRRQDGRYHRSRFID